MTSPSEGPNLPITPGARKKPTLNLVTSHPNAIASLAAIVLLALVHLWVKELRRIRVDAQKTLISVGSGASLTYVLLHILPKLAEKQEALLASAEGGLLGFLEHHAYLVALIGLVAYYAIMQASPNSAAGEDQSLPRRPLAALAATALGFGAYSLLIGYLLVNRMDQGLFSFLLITGTMGMLFLVTDHGLRKTWPDDYDRWIRWLLALALLAGWALGLFVEVSSNALTLWYAFLAGIMLISTIKEKLSIEEPGSFLPFLVGVAGSALVILILRVVSDPTLY